LEISVCYTPLEKLVSLKDIEQLAQVHSTGRSITRVLDPRPKLLDSTWLVRPLAPICQIKRQGEGQRKEIYQDHAVGKGKVNISAIFRIQT
jgi:hypothetical protein